MATKILYNGEITDDVIQTNTGSIFFNYGTGFFETILYQDKKLYFWQDHVDRLRHAAEVFEFSLHTEWLSENNVHDLIRENNLEEDILRVKILCAPVKEQGVWDIIIFAKQYERQDKDYTLFIHWEPKDGFFCNFKSVNYQALLYWRTYYKNHFNADEVLFLSFSGKTMEASSSNILVVKDRTLFYVDFHDNYLAGIMQKNIIKEYSRLDFKEVVPVKGGFTREFLEKADELLVSNSLIIAQRVAYLHTGSKKRKLAFIDHGNAEKIRNFFLMT